MWRRFIRSKSFILLIFMLIFSFGILGQVDTRMHIGGGDWDLDSLIYINVDDYMFDDPIYYYSQEPSKTSFQAAVSLDKASDDLATDTADDPGADVTEYMAEDLVDSKDKKPLEVALRTEPPAETGSEAVALTREELTPPVVEAPKVEEKKEEKKPPVFLHKVNSGETLWDIATAYGITVDTILSANDLRDPNRISIGQELQILSVQGVLHQVATGESLWEIAERYEIGLDEIAQANGISDPNRLQPNTKLVIPGATRLKPRDVLLVNGQLQKAFDWPVKGRISSPFGPRWGKMHNGLDIAVATGTSVKAAADGRVTFAGWNGGYGILVIVDHGNGVETRYAHNSRLNVKVGQKVDRGQVVAYSGNTGVSTGPHVHFEIRQRNNPVNPQSYLR